MSSHAPENWRFVLLGATSVVLSLASGWTTWDGMSNFTRAPALSFLITAGIQGVMLISAWMLGEALVNRFRVVHLTRSDQSPAARHLPMICAGLTAAAFLLLTAAPLSTATLMTHLRGSGFHLPDFPWLSALGLSLAALLLLRMRRFTTGANPTRALINTSLLALMFFVCMATSVFFSFDSLFAAVFPDAERQRASQIRVLSETDKILSGLLATGQEEQLTQKARVLSSPAWRDYSGVLDALRRRLEQAETDSLKEAAASASLTLEQGRQSRARQVEIAARKAKAERDESEIRQGLGEFRKTMSELQDLIAGLDKKIFENAQQISAAQSDARAEEAGLGATNKPGRGRQYRTLATSIEQLQITQQRLDSDREIYAGRIASVAADIEKREKLLLDKTVAVGQLAAQAADVTAEPEGAVPSSTAPRQALLRAEIQALHAARLQYEQSASSEDLEALERACKSATGVIPAAVAGEPASCSAKDVHVEAAPLYALMAGLATLPASCRARSGDTTSLPSADELLTRVRDCVQRIGLPSDATAGVRRSIDNIERNRDDKAHRFIVTMNAFADGNRLSYLALAIAVCIDGLVFVSGLLGAATKASPFVSLPNALGHTVAGADRILRCALQPDPARVASAMLAQCQPVSSISADRDPGWSHELSFDDLSLSGLPALRRIVGAAATIGAARPCATRPDHYIIRRELVEFLALHMMNAGQRNAPSSRREGMIGAMGRDTQAAAIVIASRMRPCLPEGDFVCEVSLQDIHRDSRADALRVLNAAALYGGVKPVLSANDTTKRAAYLIHRDISEYLLHLVETSAEREGKELVTPSSASLTVPPTQPAPISAGRDVALPADSASPRSPAEAIAAQSGQAVAAKTPRIREYKTRDAKVAESPLSAPARPAASSSLAAAVHGKPAALEHPAPLAATATSAKERLPLSVTITGDTLRFD